MQLDNASEKTNSELQLPSGDMQLEEVLRHLSRAQILADSIKSLTLDQPWPNFIKAFNTFSKYYNTILKKVSGNSVLETRVLVPWSLQGVEKPESLSELLRTRMDQKYEDNKKVLAQQYESTFGALDDTEEYEKQMVEFQSNCKKSFVEFTSRINEMDNEERRKVMAPNHEFELKRIQEALNHGGGGMKSPSTAKPLILTGLEVCCPEYSKSNPISIKQHQTQDQKKKISIISKDSTDVGMGQQATEFTPTLRLSINSKTKNLLHAKQQFNPNRQPYQ